MVKAPSSEARRRPLAPRRADVRASKLAAPIPAEEALQPLRQLLEVVTSQVVIANLTDNLAQPPLERGAALGRIQRRRIGLAHPQEIDERQRVVQSVRDRLGPA